MRILIAATMASCLIAALAPASAYADASPHFLRCMFDNNACN